MTRFYGPADWLHLPLRWLRCYLAMYPRLQAEEALHAVAILQAGDSNLKAEYRHGILGGWQRLAGTTSPARTRVSAAEYAAAMQELGLTHG